MNHEELRELLQVLSEGGWQRATITTDEFTLALGDTGMPAPQAATASEPAAPPVASALAPTPPVTSVESATAPRADGITVTAPSVGVAWRSPKPGAAPFVEVGQRVEAGDTVVLLEVMKLFTPIVSHVTGTVVSVSVVDGEMVEFGTPIVVVAPE